MIIVTTKYLKQEWTMFSSSLYNHTAYYIRAKSAAIFVLPILLQLPPTDKFHVANEMIVCICE